MIDMERPPQQRGLTQADVKDLMDAAASAWDAVPPRGRKAAFTWRGKKYVVTSNAMQLLVNTADGKPVASRYN